MPDVYAAPNEETKPEEKQPELTKEQMFDQENAREKAAAEDIVDEVLHRMGEHKRSELWGAYSVRPEKKIINEQTDEEVVLILRAHPITNIGWILLTILLLLVPQLADLSGVLSQFPYKYVFIGKLAWYLITLGFSFEKFLDWFYSVLVITNERIIDVDFINLLFREMQYANLDHIEQPSMVSGGFIRSFFRYGDVTVATAADAGALTIEGMSIPYPEKVIRLISELSEELEKRRKAGK